MRIISFEAARVILLLPFEEIVPMGGVDAASIISSIKSRYAFANIPDPNLPRDELTKTGIKFENSSFKINGEHVGISDFTIHTDGVVINSKTTENAELFLDDIIEWMRAEHGFRDFLSIPARRFLSQIIIEFEKPFANLIPAHKHIADVLNKRLSKVYETDVPMSLSRIYFDFDNLGEKSSMIVPKFTIERRVGVPFDRERYYCSAPMRTRDHIEVLQLIEASFANDSTFLPPPFLRSLSDAPGS